MSPDACDIPGLNLYNVVVQVTKSVQGWKVGYEAKIHVHTCNIHHDEGCSRITSYSSLAGVLSSMGLAQWVDDEGVGWGTAHSEVSTSNNGGRVARTYPLHSRSTQYSSDNITCQSVLLSKCGICISSYRHKHCV